MTCRIILWRFAERVADYDFWTATRLDCADWLSLLKWAHEAGGWMEWGK